MFEVIAGVDDDGQVIWRQDLRQPVSEFCPANTAGQCNDFQCYAAPTTEPAAVEPSVAMIGCALEIARKASISKAKWTLILFVVFPSVAHPHTLE